MLTFDAQSTSTSLQFPLEWIFQQGLGGKPLNVYAIYRAASSQSAAYVWPVTTTSQTEAVYLPGRRFFKLACRRQTVTLPSLDGRSLQVSIELMYESLARLSSQDEQRIAGVQKSNLFRLFDLCSFLSLFDSSQVLNRAIDVYNATCSPFLCQSLAWRSIPCALLHPLSHVFLSTCTNAKQRLQR